MSSPDLLVDFQKQIDVLRAQVETQQRHLPGNNLSMVVFSGSLEKVITAFILGTGAAAMGMEVSMFFTFWATSALRDRKKKSSGKNLLSKLFGIMLPKGFDHLKLSQMHLAGGGTAMIKWLMRKKKIASLQQMLDIAQECGIKIYVCEMSMDLLGIQKDELVSYKHLKFCGVAKFIQESSGSRTTLFI
jgi:peroxiredoxin family protein